MKNKWYLITSIIQLVLGILAAISIVIVCINGEDIKKWFATLLFTIFLIITGIIDIVNYIKYFSK